MPGRWAAPPAPAMITCKPARFGRRGVFAHQSGVRWADTTRHSCGTPKRVEHFVGRARIVSQSDLLPMMMPTSGEGSEVIIHPTVAGAASSTRAQRRSARCCQAPL